MELGQDEILMAFERPGTLFEWINSDRNLLRDSKLPLKVGEAEKSSLFLELGDKYPIDEDCIGLRNMIALKYLDFDAIMKHITGTKFNNPLGEKDFNDWYLDMELASDPRKVNHDVRRECFHISYHIPAFKKAMEAINSICDALFMEYMINRERALWFGGSSEPVFNGKEVMIAHWPK